MFKKIRGMFSNDLSIDLGTANTLIYVKDQGIGQGNTFYVLVGGTLAS